MKYDGTITRVEHGRNGVTLIVDTVMGLRGIELDSATWQAIVADFHVTQPDELAGWRVEYDPAHGDLEIVGPVYEESDAIDDDAEDDSGVEGHDNHLGGRLE